MCYSEFVWGLRVVEKESERMEADNMRHSPLPQFFFSFFFAFCLFVSSSFCLSGLFCLFIVLYIYQTQVSLGSDLWVLSLAVRGA